MSTDLATANENLPAFAVPQFDNRAIQQLVEFNNIVDTVFEFASKLCRTSMAGNAYRGKPEEATAAILYGAELGLNPIQSLQNVFTVHGTPGVYARTMVALLKRRGYKFLTSASTAESVTVTGTAPDGSTETVTWDMDRARTAGYVPTWDEKTNDWKKNSNGKLDGNMKYLTDGQAMLWAKCAAEISRKLAPDVLLGIAYTIEDLESERELVRVISERVDNTAPVSAADILGAPVEDDESVAAAQASDKAKKQFPEKVTPDESPQVDASNPVENQDTAPPEPKKRPSTRAKSKQESGEPPAPGTPSIEQLTALAEVLNNEGFDTTDKKLDYLSTQFKRQILRPNQLTSDEVDDLVGYLRTEQARDGGAE